MIKMFIRHATRNVVRQSLYQHGTKASRKTLKGFNALCILDNWIRWFTPRF